MRWFWTVAIVLATAGGLWWVIDPEPARGLVRIYVGVVLVIYALEALNDQWGEDNA